MRDAPKIDDAPDDIVCQFIDKYITGTLPQNSVKHEHDISRMRNLQKHAHSDYCRRNRSCRFGFPKPISSKTIISRKPIDENKKEVIEKAKSILQKIQHFISTSELDIENMSTEEILHKLSVKEDEYINALSISKQGTSIVLKRNPRDIFLNACNIDI